MNSKEGSCAPNSLRPLTFAEKLKQKQYVTSQRIVTPPTEIIKQDDQSQNKGKFSIFEIKNEKIQVGSASMQVTLFVLIPIQ